jgi:mannose-6-phosphate isomerase-like protein (cupin superfamily)
MAATENQQPAITGVRDHVSPYEKWISEQGIPIHRGYFIDDIRTVEVGWWEFRQCNAAFLVMAGQEDIQEVRITEIPPGASLPPWRIAVEEMCYVAEGNGLCTVWAKDGSDKRQFEFQKHSLFMIPPNYTYQLNNTRGNQAVRMMHVNYLPLAMLIMPIPNFMFQNEFVDESLIAAEEGNPFSEAKIASRADAGIRGVRNLWVGNFFPDMKAWDKLEEHRARGGGGSVVDFKSRTGRGGHMSVFPVGTYKRGHRHGPGTVIVIPEGDGFSVMWPQGGDKEKVYIPWHEASVFVPPNQWYHQHFNVGATPARYLAIARPSKIFETDEDLYDRQIDYTAEDPAIRAHFESELAKRGVSSLMPEDCYTIENYQWKYKGDN